MSGTSKPLPERIGVIGAGTMGAGIAQLGARAGAEVVLYDAVAEALHRGRERIESDLGRMVERGRMSAQERDQALARLRTAGTLEELRGCGVVIEAAPEVLELKRELFGALAPIVGERCVLATNTSSLSVTEIAAGTPRPERVVGMHFFNPAPVMRLVEIVAGAVSSPEALAIVRALGEAMGKTVIDAEDVAGFLVNRCARPYSLVTLRLLQERIADPAVIDRIARWEGGFRLGPLELQDLVGIDVNFAVAEAFQRQSFGEARYQPSPLQARMVASGHLGRKTGRGWYDYANGTAPEHYRPADPELHAGGDGRGRRLAVLGGLPAADELAEEAAAAGFAVSREQTGGAWLTLDCDDRAPGEGPRARLVWSASLHASDPQAAGFHVVPPLAGGRLIEVTRTAKTDPESHARLIEFVRAVGRHPEEVADSPGLVLGRIVASLVNEAAFLIGEGHGTAEGVDAGLTLGLNHPRGPVAWSAAAGLVHLVGILDALHRELGEERYRVAPLLRRRLALGERALGQA
jgi:3-hydroxybutyryl-CoA dehydrogenase